MEISGFISAIVVGLIIGILGRLMVSGRQPAGCIVTMIVGIVGALIGGWIASMFTNNFWIILLVQIVVAAIITALISPRVKDSTRRHPHPSRG